MSLEKGFTWMTDKVQVGEIPIGKVLLLLLFMGVPGKWLVRLIRWIMASTLDTTKLDYFKNVDRWTQGLGTLSGFLVAYLFKNWRGLRAFIGETGTEALTIGTLAGAIDAGFQRVGDQNRDLTNIISKKSADKIWDVITKIKGGVALAGPKETAVGRRLALGAFPEASSSAWGTEKEEEFIAGPGKKTYGLGAPEVRPEDPVQRAEEILAAKSKI